MSARLGQLAGEDHFDGGPKARHPLSRPRMVACRHRAEGQAVDLAAVDAPCDLEADRTETGDADAVGAMP